MKKKNERIISWFLVFVMLFSNIMPIFTNILNAEVYSNVSESVTYSTKGTKPEEIVTGTDLDNFTISLQYGYIGEYLGDTVSMIDSSVQIPITINIEYRGDQSYAAEEISFSIEDLKDLIKNETYREHRFYSGAIKYDVGAELKGSNSGVGDWYYHIENVVEPNINNVYVFTNKNPIEGAFTSSVEFLFTLDDFHYPDFIHGYTKTFISTLEVNEQAKKSNELYYEFLLTPEQYDITKIEAMQYNFETSSTDSSTYEVMGYKLNDYYIMRANTFIDTYSTYRGFSTQDDQEFEPESFGSVIFEVPEDVKIISINSEYDPYEILFNEDYKKGGKINYYTSFRPDPEEYLEVSSGYSLLLAVPKANYSIGDSIDISTTIEGILMYGHEQFYDKETTSIDIHDTVITILPPGNFQAEKLISPKKVSMHTIEIKDGVEICSELIGYYENKYTDAVLTKTVIDDYFVSFATNAEESGGKAGISPSIDEYYVTRATFTNIKNNNSTVDIYVLPYGKTDYELFGTYNITPEEDTTEMTVNFNRTDIQFVRFEINGDFMANTTSEENLSKIQLYAHLNPSKNYASGLGYDFYFHNFAKMNLYSSDGLSYYEDCYNYETILVPEVSLEAKNAIFSIGNISDKIYYSLYGSSLLYLYGADKEIESLEIYEFKTSFTYPSLLEINESSILFRPLSYLTIKDAEWITDSAVPIDELPDFISVSYETVNNDDNTNTIHYTFKFDPDHPAILNTHDVKQNLDSALGIQIQHEASFDYDAYMSLKTQGILPSELNTSTTTTVLKSNTNFEKFYWLHEETTKNSSTRVPTIAGHTFEGVEKFVNVGEGYTKEDSFVGFGREYSYKLRLYGGQATVDSIVFYDNLEEAYGENEYWKGTFNGIDTTLLDYYYNNKDYSYTIYYSADKAQPFDLTASGWVKAEDWTSPLSDVKSIAVDLTNFELLTGSNVYIVVKMLAPETGEIGVKAYNSYAVDYISYDATTGIKMEDIKALPSNIVKVALNEFSYIYNFEKQWITEGVEDIILKPVSSDEYSFDEFKAAVTGKALNITATGEGLETTTFESSIDTEGNITIPSEYQNYTIFTYSAVVLNKNYTYKYNVVDKVVPEKPDKVIVNSSYDDVITLTKENGYVDSLALSNPNMVFIEEDVEGWFTSSTGNGLAITFNKNCSAHSGQIVIYYKYGNNTYRSPFYKCNDLANQTIEIPSTEFWLHFSGYNQPPYNNYYGFKIDSIINKDVSTVIGNSGATIPTWYETIELPLGVYPESDHFPHIYGDVVYHYSQEQGNENITVTKVNDYEYDVLVTNTAKLIPSIESTVEKSEYVYTIQKDWSITDIKEVIVLGLIDDPVLSLDKQKTLRADNTFSITATSPVFKTITFEATADENGLITVPSEYQNYKKYSFSVEDNGATYILNYNISGFYPNNKPDINVNLSNGETITLTEANNWSATYKTDNKNLGFVESEIEGWENGSVPNGLAITFSDKCSAPYYYGRVIIYYEYEGKPYMSNTYGPTELAGRTLEIPATDFYIYWNCTRASDSYYGFSIDNIVSKEVSTVLGEATTSLPTSTPIELGSGSYPETPHNPIVVGTSLWHYTHSVSSDNVTITKTSDNNYKVNIVNTGNLYPIMSSSIENKTYTYNFIKEWNTDNYNDLILGPVESDLITIEEQKALLANNNLSVSVSGNGLDEDSFSVYSDSNGNFTIPAEYVKYSNITIEFSGYKFNYVIGNEVEPIIPDSVNITSSRDDTLSLTKENNWQGSITSIYNNLKFYENDIDNWEEGTSNGLAITFSDECNGGGSYSGYLNIFYQYKNRMYRSAEYTPTSLAGKTITIPSREFWLFWYGGTSGADNYGFKITDINSATMNYATGTMGMDIPFSTSTLIDLPWYEYPESTHYPYNSGNVIWHYSVPAAMDNISITQTDDYNYKVNVVNTGKKTKSVISSSIEIGNEDLYINKYWDYTADTVKINVVDQNGYAANFEKIDIYEDYTDSLVETIYPSENSGLIIAEYPYYWTDYTYTAKVYLLDGSVQTVTINENPFTYVPVKFKVEILNYNETYEIELNAENNWSNSLKVPANARLKISEITKGNWFDPEPFEGTIEEWNNDGSSLRNVPNFEIPVVTIVIPEPEEIIDTGNMSYASYLPIIFITGLAGFTFTRKKKK